MSEITLAELDYLVWNTSIHLECESITIRIILPSNGPAKSMCNIQGRGDHFHVCRGATCGLGCLPDNDDILELIFQCSC